MHASRTVLVKKVRSSRKSVSKLIVNSSKRAPWTLVIQKTPCTL